MTSLFATVAFMNIAVVLATTAGTLIAAETGGAGWSGLPSAMSVLGTALAALGSGTLISWRGRRFTLLAGYGVATGGALAAFAGAVAGALAPLLIGLVMLGVGNAVAQLSRYLAADLYPVERKGFGLSVIVWAGTVGALVGPALIAPTAAMATRLGLPELSGPIAMSALVVAAAMVSSAVLPDVPTTPVRQRMSLSSLRLRAVRLPLAAMVAAHVTMVAVMTMTPPQLHHHGHGLDVVGWVLSAHMIGMFALSPLSGKIADRIGGRATIGCGVGTLAVAVVLATTMPTSHAVGLPISLFLLGYGWNLAFVGGSSLLSRDLPADVRTQAQGLIDAVVWGSAFFASIVAGQLYGVGGYRLVAGMAGALAVLPLALGFLVRRGNRVES